MYKSYSLKSFSDSKGKLVPIEFADLELFEAKRIYVVYDNLTDRGGHAHLREEEFFFMASGSCVCRLHDGSQWIEIELQVGENAVYVGKMIWHEFSNFSEGASLVALSSTSYNPSRVDYIEDFNNFILEKNNT